MTICILNTRPAHQATRLTQLIEARGYEVFHLPLIEIVPLIFSPIDLTLFDYIIFTSVNAVNYFFSQHEFKNVEQANYIAIGPATQQALIDALQCAATVLCPETFTSNGILLMPELQSIYHQSILIVSGDNPKPLLKNELKKRGARAQMIFCYQRKLIAYNMQAVFPELQKANIQLIICTSNEMLSHLMRLFTVHPDWLHEKTLCVAHFDIKARAISEGFHNVILAENATDEAM